jgi:hypothetical protein
LPKYRIIGNWQSGFFVQVEREINMSRNIYAQTGVFCLMLILIGSSYVTSVEASDQPLIYGNNLIFIGAFRVPNGKIGNSTFSYGGAAITYNPINKSLFLLGASNNVAEINIPVPVKSSNASDLNTATIIQSFFDITEGKARNLAVGGTDVGTGGSIGGLLVYNNKLIGTSYSYYDGRSNAVLSHFTTGLNLSILGDFAGMYAVGSPPSVPTASFVSGWMTHVPINFQDALGGPVLTGNGTLSVISRTSHGPAAFSFDPSRLGIDTPVSATPLLYYPSQHANLGADTTTNPLYNISSQIAGITMVNGSRSVLFFGTHGIGEYNYGGYSSDPIHADVCTAPDICIQGPKGWPICADVTKCTTGRKGLPNDNWGGAPAGVDGYFYDPDGGGKGPHAYPYIHQVWAYDANDFASVKSGTKNPWDVLPYAIWTLPFPVAPTYVFGGATAYDPTTQTIYVVSPEEDSIGRLPLIHAFKVDLTANPAQSYKIRGVAMLLNGTVMLRNNGVDELKITASDRRLKQEISFATPIPPGGKYNVTVASQPEGQNCTVLHGSGTVNANTAIANIVLTCTNIPKSALKAPLNLKRR